jgi:hypothetical protein
MLIGCQKPGGAQIAARGQQSGRFAQRLVQGRKPIRVRLLPEPDQPAQSRNSSSGTRWKGTWLCTAAA